MTREVIYISKEQFLKIKEELDYLKNIAIREVAEKIKSAIELGDLSENSEYETALNEKERVERKIFELTKVLKNCKIIKTKKTRKRKVILPGAKFEVINKITNERFIFTLVGYGESDYKSMKISTQSPLGKAFLNKKENDLVEIKTPRATYLYQIKKIF